MPVAHLRPTSRLSKMARISRSVPPTPRRGPDAKRVLRCQRGVSFPGMMPTPAAGASRRMPIASPSSLALQILACRNPRPTKRSICIALKGGMKLRSDPPLRQPQRKSGRARGRR